MKKVIALVLALVLAIGVFAGCGAKEDEKKPSGGDSEKQHKIAMIANASVNDGGWNQSCYAGMCGAAEKYGFETAYTENVAEADYVTTFSDYANMGFDLIFAPGNEFTDAVVEVAPNYPDVGFIILNGTVSGDNYISIKCDNVEMGFMAGVVAGLKTKSNQLGYISAIEITTSIDCLSGYEQGAKYVNDAVEISSGYTGSWTDTAKGKEIAVSMITTKNVDVFFGNAGTIDVGVREGAAEHDGCYGIAQPSESLSENPDVILTSVITDNVALLSVAMEAYLDGSFGNSVTVCGAKDGVLSYGEFGNNAGDLKDQVMKIYDKLVAGEIELTYNEA